MSITARDLRQLAESNRPTVIKTMVDNLLNQFREIASSGQMGHTFKFAEGTDPMIVEGVLAELQAKGFTVTKGEMVPLSSQVKSYIVSWSDAV